MFDRIIYEGMIKAFPNNFKNDVLTFKGQSKGRVFDYEDNLKFDTVNKNLEVSISFSNNGNSTVDLMIFCDGKLYSKERFSSFKKSVNIKLPRNGFNKFRIVFYSEWVPFTLESVLLKTNVESQVEKFSSKEDILCFESKLRVASDGFKAVSCTVIEKAELAESSLLLHSLGLTPENLIELFQKEAVDNELGQDVYKNSPIVDVSHKHEYIKKGQVSINSPYDPEGVVISFSSIPLTSKVTSIVYEFYDKEPILVFSDLCFSGTVGFVWLPASNLIVFDKAYWSSSWVSTYDAISMYLSVINDNEAEIIDYRKKDKTLALVSKTTGNMGHFFWNEMTGLISALSILGNEAQVPIYEMKSDWITLKDYFPEQVSNILVGSKGTLEQDTFKKGLMLIRPTESIVSEFHAEYIKTKNDNLFKKGFTDEYNEISKLKSDKNILFINLRAHNKTWTRQVEGIVTFINEYQELSKKEITVYFDGWTDCEDVMNSICSKINSSITVHNGLGVSMDRTLIWAFSCDFFLAIIGSGLVPLTWLASKPGICITNLRHLKQLDFWYLVRAKLVPFFAPKVSEIIDPENTMYSNFDISDDLLKGMLENYYNKN